MQMNAAPLVPRAGTVRPIVSQRKKPNPVEFAKVTTDMIVQAKPEADYDRKLKVAALRRDIAGLFIDFFKSLTPVSNAQRVALAMEEQMIARAGKSEWAQKFADPVIKAAIRDVLIRNVASYIALARG